MQHQYTDEFVTRFWSHVDTTSHPGDCWLWTMATNRGYGVVGIGGKRLRGTHLVAYELVVGPIPAGLYLSHLCHNPTCCRPDHLRPSTQGENMRLSAAAGRCGHFRLPVVVKPPRVIKPKPVRWLTKKPGCKTPADFLARLDRTGECWLWTDTVFPNGYGQVPYCGKIRYAHRLAYELANGPIPEGLQINHRCDVRNCANPDHLYAGTQLENVREAASKGRMKGWSRRPGAHAGVSPTHPTHPPRGVPARSSLSESTISEIRRLYEVTTFSQKHIATIYGISPSYVSRIIRSGNNSGK